MRESEVQVVVVVLDLLCKLLVLSLSFTALLLHCQHPYHSMHPPDLWCFEVLAVGIGRVAHGLDRIVVHLEAERNALMVRILRLVRAIHIDEFLELK